jgi:protein gp37
MKVHRVAARFPALSEEKLIGLADDIKTNGQLHPIIITWDGVLVDGINRLEACELAKVKPNFRKLPKSFDEARIVRLIISSNLQRRDLEVGQRAMLALELAPELEAAAKERQRAGKGADGSGGRGKKKNLRPKSAPGIDKGKVTDELAAEARVAGSTMRQAKAVAEASARLAADVAAGKISLNDAYKKVRSQRRDEEPKATKNAGMVTLQTHDGKKVQYRLPKSKPTFNTTNEHISWAAWSWNPVTGCLHGCKYCYARELATKPSYAAAYPLGFTPLFHPERLIAPANTKVPDKADMDGRFRRVFVCSMADLYGKWVPDDWIDQVHQSCITNPQWDYLMLTKFPRRYVGLKLPTTAWLGTSVDEQKRVRLAEEAFEQIKDVKVKWLSLEPLLAPLEFSDLSMFDWIVIGSQTQTEQPDGIVEAFAPPFAWVARIVDQAREAGCRVYLKPNLIGRTDPQSPGMTLPQEIPKAVEHETSQQASLFT